MLLKSCFCDASYESMKIPHQLITFTCTTCREGIKNFLETCKTTLTSLNTALDLRITNAELYL